MYECILNSINCLHISSSLLHWFLWSYKVDTPHIFVVIINIWCLVYCTKRVYIKTVFFFILLHTALKDLMYFLYNQCTQLHDMFYCMPTIFWQNFSPPSSLSLLYLSIYMLLMSSILFCWSFVSLICAPFPTPTLQRNIYW